MKEYVLRNARVVTPTTVMQGHVLVRDGLVADVDEGDIQPAAGLECIDCEGTAYRQSGKASGAPSQSGLASGGTRLFRP